MNFYPLDRLEHHAASVSLEPGECWVYLFGIDRRLITVVGAVERDVIYPPLGRIITRHSHAGYDMPLGSFWFPSLSRWALAFRVPGLRVEPDDWGLVHSVCREAGYKPTFWTPVPT